jgi:hypothetical protein
MCADSWSAIAATPKKQPWKNGKYQFKCRNGMMISLSRFKIPDSNLLSRWKLMASFANESPGSSESSDIVDCCPSQGDESGEH